MHNKIHSTKNSHQLVEGDVILHYGAYLLLTNRQTHGMRPTDCERLQGECITFEGIEIAREANAMLPKHWTAKGYNVQGNKLAMWCVVTAE